MRTFTLSLSAVAMGILATGCTPPRSELPHQEFASSFPEPSGRALEAEDYYAIRSLRGFQVSPDGGWVAYAVGLPVEETNGDLHEVWVVRTDGSQEPRHILHEGAEVSAPSWTGDGRLLYSAGGRWSVDPADPGAVPRREEASPDPGNRSPDGFWVASLEEGPGEGLGDIEPSESAGPDFAPSGLAASDFAERHEARFRGRQFDWLNFQRDGAPLPAPDPTANPPREIVISPVEGASALAGDGTAEAKILTDLGLRPGAPVWHPSSGLLAFTADPNWQDETLYSRTDIWLVDVMGRSTRVTDDGWSYGSIGFSPDGRYLSFTGGYGTDMIKDGGLDHGGPRDLFVLDLEGVSPYPSEESSPGPLSLPALVNLTAEWDLDPSGPLWNPDSEYIYFRAEKNGGSHLFRVPAAGGGVEQVTWGERSFDGIQISEDFSKLVYSVGLFESPADLYASEMDGSGEVRLTRINEDFTEEVTLSRAERLLYPSYDGTPIEGWLLYPYGYHPDRGPYPLIVHSHGGPHSASGYSFDFKHQLFAANGYFVLQTNFRSSTGYGEAFKWATWGAWGDKDGEDVMAGIDYAALHFSIDSERVASIGHSYGGFMTNWLISRYPDRFVAAAPGAGIVNWVSDYGTADIARTKETEFFGTPWETEARNRMIRQSPLTYADQVQAATLFIHGELDERVPYSEAEQMFVALKKNGVPAKIIQYEGQFHGIRGHWNSVHRMLNELAWFDEWVK